MNDVKHTTDLPDRRIRSFVRRQGRLTPGQQRALDELWPRYGLEVGPCPEDFDTRFGRAAPRTLEIGFGNGNSLAQMASDDPGSDFIGIEVHRPGVGHLLQELHRRQLGNVRLYCHDAVEVLDCSIASTSLDRVLLFFPDPWHKKKHHKRRILQPAFVAQVADRLKPGGHFHMATDWQPYAEHMLEVMQSCREFRNCSTSGGFVERPAYRPVTKFETRGRRLGHAVRDLLFSRN